MLKCAICLIGMNGVGKTSLLRRAGASTLEHDYTSVLGVQIGKKKVELDGRTVTLLLWDLAGDGTLGRGQSGHLARAQAHIIVSHVSRRATLEGAIDLQTRTAELTLVRPFATALKNTDLG